MPHLSRPTRDGYVAQQFGLDGGEVQPGLDAIIDPSWQTKASENGGRFVTPAPDFTTPQAQARLNVRGSTYEIGLSAGTALEKLPSLYATPAFERLLRDGDATAILEVVDNLQLAPADPDDELTMNGALNQLQLFDVAYHRYIQIGLDGSVDVAPLTFAFELTYSPSRHFYTARPDGTRLAQPNTSRAIEDAKFDREDGLTPSNVSDSSIREGVPTVQGVLHVDWIHGETFVLALEGFWLNALKLPYDKSRDWLAFKPDTGAYLAGVFGATYRLNDGQWSFETSLIALLGPSIISISQIELRVRQGMFLNVGAMIYEGPRTTPGAQNISIGGMLTGYDQLFVGFRYLP
jgi:hypothetical protein